MLKCSIIIVSKNNVSDVEYTLSSLYDVGLDDCCEIICIDDSDDDKIETLIGEKQKKLKNMFYLRGDGHSLYSAMNIGIKKSSGEYLWFLNSGDSRHLDFTKQELQSVTGDIFYGNTTYINEGQVHSLSTAPRFSTSDKNKLKHSLPCHQSILFNRKFLERHKIFYDLEVPVSADYKFIESCVSNRATIVYRPIFISNFTLGGISTQYKNLSQLRKHAQGIKITRNLNFVQHKILFAKLLQKLRW